MIVPAALLVVIVELMAIVSPALNTMLPFDETTGDEIVMSCPVVAASVVVTVIVLLVSIPTTAPTVPTINPESDWKANALFATDRLAATVPIWLPTLSYETASLVTKLIDPTARSFRPIR